MCEIDTNNKEATSITDETLFLIGNGCSMEYGFPNGHDLLVECFNFIQQYHYGDDSFLSAKAHNLQLSFQYFLSLLSDLHEQSLYGNLDGLHYPLYSSELIMAQSPDLCQEINSCLYPCADKKNQRNIAFKKSPTKHDGCSKLRGFLSTQTVWKIFSEFVDKYYDSKTYGQGLIADKKTSIKYGYDNLAKLTFDLLFQYYKNASLNGPFDVFVQKLNKFSVNIINMNYDLLLENSMANIKNGNKLEIIKPHGSFDIVYYEQTPPRHWGVNPIGKNAYKFSTQSGIDDFYNGRFSPFAVPLCVAYADLQTHQAIPDVKQSLFIENLTKPALEDLEIKLNAIDKIISIGYSFSETYDGKRLIDEHIISKLRGKKIFVVGKGNTEPEVGRIKKHYPNIKTHATNFNGFKDYCEKMP